MTDHIQDDMDEDEANLFMERSVMCEEVTLPGCAARRIARYISNLRVESDNDLAEVRALVAKLMALNEELVAQNKALKDATPRHDEALLRIYLSAMPFGKYRENDDGDLELNGAVYCPTDEQASGISQAILHLLNTREQTEIPR